MSSDQTRTLGATLTGQGDPVDERVPGVVLVYSEGRAVCGGIPLRGETVEIGRGTVGDVVIADGHMSRRHVSLRRDGDAIVVRDLGSRNGFVLDTVRVPTNGEVRVTKEAVLRLGNSLFLIVDEVRPFREHGLKTQDGFVIGPRLAAAY